MKYQKRNSVLRFMGIIVLLAMLTMWGIAAALAEDVTITVSSYDELYRAVEAANTAGKNAEDGKAPLYTIQLKSLNIPTNPIVYEGDREAKKEYPLEVLKGSRVRMIGLGKNREDTVIGVDWGNVDETELGSWFVGEGELTIENVTFDFAGTEKWKDSFLPFLFYGETITLKNVSFKNVNKYNDGDEQRYLISALLTDLRMENCLVEGCYAYADEQLGTLWSGALVHLWYQSSLYMDNCVFRNNQGGLGTCVNVNSGGKRVVVKNSVFEKNIGRSYPCLEGANCELEIENCRFIENEAKCLIDAGKEGGGAIAIAKAKATIKNSVFQGNKSDSAGGAIDIAFSSDVTIEKCIITDNVADTHGGAICITDYYEKGSDDDSKLTIRDTRIANNTAKCIYGKEGNTGSVFAPGGGGIYVHPQCELVLEGDACIEQNKALNGGNGGGVYLGFEGKLTIDGAKVMNNTAQNGGGVYLEEASRLEISIGTHVNQNHPGDGGNLQLKDGLISGNMANGNGGGVYVGGGDVIENEEYAGGLFEMTGGVITDNLAKDAGGGVYLEKAAQGNKSGSFRMTDGALYYNTAGENGNTSTGEKDMGAELYAEGSTTEITVPGADRITAYIQNGSRKYVPAKDRSVWFADWYDDYSDQDAAYGKVNGRQGTGVDTGRYMSSYVIDKMVYQPSNADTGRRALILDKNAALTISKKLQTVDPKKMNRFAFEITLPEAEKHGEKYPYTKVGQVSLKETGATAAGVQYVRAENGKISFEMEAGDELTIHDLPVDSAFRVKETQSQGYAASVSVSNAKDSRVNHQEKTAEGKTAQTSAKSGDTRVAFYNYIPGELPQTGDKENGMFWFALAALAMAGAAKCRGRRKIRN